MRETYALVGDIGGTNCRLALVRTDENPLAFYAPHNMRCAEHDSFDAALSAYLNGAAGGLRVDRAVLAVAGPVVDGRVDMTNHPWTVTEARLSSVTGGSARLINDYAALAYAAPALTDGDLRTVGPVLDRWAEGTIAVLGAGTGFGVSALVRDNGQEAALVGEGGHVAFAPTDAVETDVLRILQARFGRVSVERLLSGPGLLNLHQALSEIQGVTPTYRSPDAVTAAAAAGEARAVECTERFCAILGSVAGDFALAYGARGGVQIAGGVSQLLLATPAAAAFRPRFEDKGRFRTYLAGISTTVVLHPQAALVGAARALRMLETA